jgi:hypothetical protein
LVQAWRDLGPEGWWLATAAAAAGWAALVALAAVAPRPRRVRPATDVFDLPGDAPPAVVNQLTSGWSLEHEAIPATLLDLAARGHVSIHSYGDGVTVHVPDRSSGPEPGAGSDRDELTPYEQLVLTHVEQLALRVPDRRVPAGALAHGPDEQAKRWWSRFRSAVATDTERRGLIRKRWSRRAKLLLGLAALLPAMALSFTWGAYTYQGEDGKNSEQQSS